MGKWNEWKVEEIETSATFICTKFAYFHLCSKPSMKLNNKKSEKISDKKEKKGFLKFLKLKLIRQL